MSQLAWSVECGTGYFVCGNGCAPKGSNCCSEHNTYCPGDKPIACPAKGACYTNQSDAERAGCTNWIVCGAPVE